MRLIFITIFLSLALPAAAAKRVALVIGNGAYTVQPSLRNPVPDAKAIAERLTAANFKVTLGIDLTNQGMRQTINEFAATVPGSEAALLFFAGHGVQVNGENYLIPVDAKIRRVADLTWQTVRLSTLVSELEGRGRTSIIILDACRDNPGLARRLRGLGSGRRQLAVGQGLAQVSAPDGSYVAFSTAPDTFALDGDGKHSPFAGALIKHLPTPGLDIALMMRRVRHDVRESTQRQQTPWDSSSLTQPFYFVPRTPTTGSSSLPKSATTRPTAKTAPPGPRVTAREAFRITKSIGTCEAYNYFLQDYPKGFLANMARAWKVRNCKTQLPLGPQQAEQPPIPTKKNLASVPKTRERKRPKRIGSSRRPNKKTPSRSKKRTKSKTAQKKTRPRRAPSRPQPRTSAACREWRSCIRIFPVYGTTTCPRKPQGC
ncbi:MAG: caspase family protein [Hyphomicrobiaceae bacterium]